MESLLIASETFETSLCWNSDSEVAAGSAPTASDGNRAKGRSHSAAPGESTPKISAPRNVKFPNTIHGSLTRTRKPRARLRPASKDDSESGLGASSSSSGAAGASENGNPEEGSGSDTERAPILAVQSVPNTPVKKVPLSKRTRERLHAALRGSAHGSPRHHRMAGSSVSYNGTTGGSPKPSRHALDAHNGGATSASSANGITTTPVSGRKYSRPASANSNSSRESLSSYPCTATSFEYPAENKTSRQRKALAHRSHGPQCNGKCNMSHDTASSTSNITNSPIRPPRHAHRHRHHGSGSASGSHRRSHSDTRSTDSSVTGGSGGSGEGRPTRAASESRTSTGENGTATRRAGGASGTNGATTNSGSNQEYLTPLQRKDRIIRDLKGELKTSHKLIGVYERQVEKLKEKQQVDENIQTVIDDKDRDIAELKDQLSEARLRCSDLMERHEIDGRTIEELRAQIQEYIAEMEERERVHQQMYLETYKKGQECAKIERYEQDIARETRDDVSFDELLEKLEQTESKLEHWQTLRRKEAYETGTASLDACSTGTGSADAESLMRVMKDALFHYVTDSKNSSHHLRLMVAIMRYREDQKLMIEKVLYGGKKKRNGRRLTLQ